MGFKLGYLTDKNSRYIRFGLRNCGEFSKYLTCPTLDDGEIYFHVASLSSMPLGRNIRVPVESSNEF